MTLKSFTAKIHYIPTLNNNFSEKKKESSFNFTFFFLTLEWKEDSHSISGEKGLRVIKNYTPIVLVN